MLKYKKKIILFVSFWVLVITLSFYGWQILKSPNVLLGGKKAKYIILPTRLEENGELKKTTYKDVINILKKEKIIADFFSFAFLAKLSYLDVDFKPGRYKLEPNTNNITFIKMLKSGLQAPVNVSFHNVRLVEDLAQKMTRHLDMTEQEFLDAFHDKTIQEKYGFTDDNFLCAFIPNTYEVYYTVSPQYLIKKMLKEYKKFWNEERIAIAKNFTLTQIDVCTLASIVQAETIKEKEYAAVAGLYYNRLMQGMKLQADPTIVYAMKKFDIRRVTLDMIRTQSPYNTYLNKGLPPGPINLPTQKVLDAVLHLQKHKYIFMCSKDDFSGYHNFAVTLSEHKKNAQKYRRALDKRKIFK